MKTDITKVHCMFEQSGTFKNEFIKLGIDAVDYDIQNNFGQTDYIIDLFAEIERRYENVPSVFDNIKQTDLIMAFFPCIYFESLQMSYYTSNCNNNRNIGKRKFDVILERIVKRERLYILLYKLVGICEIRGLRLIIENPATKPHYLLFPENFYAPPTFVDRNRTLRGDSFKKPTAYWFFGLKPTSGRSYCNPDTVRTIQKAKKGICSGICSEERSMISPIYAKNFICDFILGKENEFTQRTLF